MLIIEDMHHLFVQNVTSAFVYSSNQKWALDTLKWDMWYAASTNGISQGDPNGLLQNEKEGHPRSAL